ncbi:MAG: hypothetical protein OEV55_10290, partial [candidate division Zixibacteria bacterium]|nr:hypothetical protein [candidate division Zixibacteria bacterium]
MFKGVLSTLASLVFVSFLFLTPLAFPQDPGTADTVRIECLDIVRPNSQVVVNVYVINDENLSGISIPLAYPDTFTHLDITCDSISFVGTRGASAAYKADTSSIDNATNRVNVFAVWFSGFLTPGNGSVAKLYFTTGPSWDSTLYVPVDSFIWTKGGADTKLEFARTDGIGFLPIFTKGCLGYGEGPPPTITVTSPNGGEVWYVGENHNITWTSSDFTGNVKIEYSTDGGSGWTTIIASTADDGVHPWTIPNAPTNQGRIKVSDAADGTPSDMSNADFSIPDFTIGATPGSRVVDIGASTNYTVNLGYLYGFAHSVNLTILDLPTGATGNFSPNPVNPPANSSVLNVNTTGATPAGHYTLTIRGEGSQIHTTQVTLVVNAAPSSFALLSPDSGSTVSILTPTLSWQQSTDPDPLDTVKYILYYTRNSDFSSYDSIPNITGTSRTLPALQDDTVYYWKARAVDKWGKSTWSSNTWNFRTNYPQPPATFTLIHPPDKDTIWQFSDSLIWHKTTDPDPGDSVVYDLYIDTQPGFASPTIISDLSDTSYYFTGQDDSTYYWKVLAKDINTSGRWSTQTFRFDVYVVQPPDPFTLASPDSASTVSTL